MDDDSQSSTGSKPSSPAFRMSFTIQTPSFDSINSPSTNDTTWVERLSGSLVSSMTTSEFLSPIIARKLQPDGSKRSRSMTALRVKQIRKDRKLENKISAAQQEHSA
ncbi:hypothetical protein CPC08DRAFT_764890 [Agrocybe pediades]|nr:hypothetical protein CPC08DRAFT_764890 [Agrocybe pediades]